MIYTSLFLNLDYQAIFVKPYIVGVMFGFVVNKLIKSLLC